VELLQGKFEIFVVAPESLLEVDLLSEGSGSFEAVPFPVVPQNRRIARVLGRLKRYFEIRRLVERIKPDIIVFNSTYSLVEVALIHLLFKDYRRIQIIHNFQRFLSPLGRLLYSGFDGSLVISEQVHEYVTCHHPYFSDLGYFLPIFFGQQFRPICHESCRPAPSGRRLQLVVVGSVEEDRRNYWGLLEAVRSECAASDDIGFHITFVGKTSAMIESYIRDNGLDPHISFAREFVPFSQLFGFLTEADLVLYLVDREVGNVRYYNRYKTTATSLWVKGFRKVGIASTDFLIESGLAEMTFRYEGTDIQALLREIDQGKISIETVQAREVRFKGQSIYSFGLQQARLISFIEGVLQDDCLGESRSLRKSVDPGRSNMERIG
jgi:hypothetical protein